MTIDKDLVIGIDSSTSATKTIAWNRDGIMIAQSRLPIVLSNPRPGYFEQDPNEWWTSTVGALKILGDKIDLNRIVAVSISNQRETFAIFDKNNQPLYPGLVWLDERASECQQFGETFGPERIRALSGKPIDVVVPLYRMIWLRKNKPEIFAKIAHFADVHCYLNFCFTGRWLTSIASADPSGMVDMLQKCWSKELLTAAKIPINIMPPLLASGQHMGRVTKQAAQETGLLQGTPVIAGGGDGQCAASGVGIFEPSTAYMNLGTAIVAGVYSTEYKYDLAFRTEFAVSDYGYIFETVLKSGTFLIDWFVKKIMGQTENTAEFLNQLEQEARQSPIGSGGMVLLPFWQGSMTPHWDSDARGIIAGFSGSSKRGDIYRALLEGLALDQAFALEKAQKASNSNIKKIIAIGGGAASPLLLQIIANSLNVQILRSKIIEASSLGAAMAAATGIGWFQNLHSASQKMSQKDYDITIPKPYCVDRYSQLRTIYDDLWPQIATWNQRLRTFAKNTKG